MSGRSPSVVVAGVVEVAAAGGAGAFVSGLGPGEVAWVFRCLGRGGGLTGGSGSSSWTRVVARASGLIGCGAGNSTVVCGIDSGPGGAGGGVGAGGAGLGAGTEATAFGLPRSAHALEENAKAAARMNSNRFMQSFRQRSAGG
jgi:hypothetical protein